MNSRLYAAGVLLLAILAAAVALPLMVGGTEAARTSGCGPGLPAVDVDADTLPGGSLGSRGWTGEQLYHAAIIIDVGSRIDGVGRHGQTVAVMTAMGESSLRNLDFGDQVGPDSRGLFQQRDSWGTLAERMHPPTASRLFYEALLQVDGWAELAPTMAAHRTQRNADPFHYEPFWADAQTVVAGLSGAVVTVGLGGGGTACGVSPGLVSTEGWTVPTRGPITSGYGYRIHPLTGNRRLHHGTDIGAPAGQPIYAAAGGRVIEAGYGSCTGNYVRVDHGGEVHTRYLHMLTGSMMVTVGDIVAPGQQLGGVGSTGCSTGPHLHFEVNISGSTIDPEPFMADLGAPLGVAT